MQSKNKQPSLEVGLLIILLVISIFSIGYYTEGNITGMFVKENKEEGLEKVSGKMVKVSGMEVVYNKAEKQWYDGNQKITSPPTNTAQVKVIDEQGNYHVFRVDSFSAGRILLSGGTSLPSTSGTVITGSQPPDITWKLTTPSGTAYEKAQKGDEAIANYRTKVGDTTKALSITATRDVGSETTEPGSKTYIMVLRNSAGNEVYQSIKATESTFDSIINVYLNDRKITSGDETWTITKQPVLEQPTITQGINPGGTKLFLQGMDPTKDSGLPISIRPDGLYDVNQEINHREYLYNPNTGGLTLKSITTPDGQVDLSKVEVKMIDPSTKTLTLTIGGKTSIARYDEVRGTYTIEGTNIEAVYSAGKLYPTSLSSGAGEGAIYTPEYTTYKTETKEYEPLFIKDGKYYWLSGNPVVSIQILKTPTKIGEVTVSEIYSVNDKGEISSESTGRRITEGNQYVDVSEEVYEKLDISETDRIEIGTNSLTRIDSTGYKTTLTKTGSEEKIVTTEKEVTITTVYNTLLKTTTTTTYNSKTKTTQREIKSADGHTLKYDFEEGKDPEEIKFTTADGRETKIEDKDIIVAVKNGDISVNHLYLAREISDSTALFGWSRDQTDSNWEFKDDKLKIGNTVIWKTTEEQKTLIALNGEPIEKESIIAYNTNSKTIYAKTEGGYTYWNNPMTGDKAISTKDDVTFNLDPKKAYSVTQEFVKDTKIAGETFRKGDYIRIDYSKDGKSDGKLVYKYGALQGVIVNDKFYDIKDFFNEKGEFKAPKGTSENDDGVKFIKEKYYEWSLASIGVRLKGAYKSAQGGRALSTLLGFEDNTWRKTMDNFFANTVLGQAISGRWEDSICHSQIPRDRAGILNFVLPGNIIGVGAHVGAERTTTTFPNGTSIYLYKITYGINNPKFEERGKSHKLKYNIFLYGDRTIKLFKQDREIEEGEIVRGMGTSPDAIPPRYSSYLYTKICLKFSELVETASGKLKDEVCNTITPYQGPATKYPTTETTITTTGTTPSTEGEGDINDF